jgi:hypothetical protein
MSSGSRKSKDGGRNTLAALAASALAAPLVLSASFAGTQSDNTGVAPLSSTVQKAASKSERGIIIIGTTTKKKKKIIRKKKQRGAIIKSKPR